MLLSVLISLSPTFRSPVLGSLGRPIQAWFLEQVTRHRPDLGKVLHDESGVRPYTVSTLLDDHGMPYPAGRWLLPGESCWLRITTFSQELSRIMMDRILPGLPNSLTLYRMKFRVDGYTFDPAQHSWANQTSYTHLAQSGNLKHKNRQVRFEFASPTTFRSKRSDIPLPLPGNVFRSYWLKWNAYATPAIQLQDIWPQFAEECIKVSELTAVNTERWSFADGTRGVATGFTGTVGFVLLPKRQCEQWGEYWDGADQVLQTLAQFSFYCGTGYHATIGLGQTRPLLLSSDNKSGGSRRRQPS